jgi:hypothetical protein
MYHYCHYAACMFFNYPCLYMARKVADKTRGTPVNAELKVKVIYTTAADSAARMSRAIDLLLAAAQPDEDSDNNIELKNLGKDPARSEYKRDSTDTGR